MEDYTGFTDWDGNNYEQEDDLEEAMAQIVAFLRDENMIDILWQRTSQVGAMDVDFDSGTETETDTETRTDTESESESGAKTATGIEENANAVRTAGKGKLAEEERRQEEEEEDDDEAVERRGAHRHQGLRSSQEQRSKDGGRIEAENANRMPALVRDNDDYGYEELQRDRRDPRSPAPGHLRKRRGIRKVLAPVRCPRCDGRQWLQCLNCKRLLIARTDMTPCQGGVTHFTEACRGALRTAEERAEMVNLLHLVEHDEYSMLWPENPSVHQRRLGVLRQLRWVREVPCGCGHRYSPAECVGATSRQIDQPPRGEVAGRDGRADGERATEVGAKEGAAAGMETDSGGRGKHRPQHRVCRSESRRAKEAAARGNRVRVDRPRRRNSRHHLLSWASCARAGSAEAEEEGEGGERRSRHACHGRERAKAARHRPRVTPHRCVAHARRREPGPQQRERGQPLRVVPDKASALPHILPSHRQTEEAQIPPRVVPPQGIAPPQGGRLCGGVGLQPIQRAEGEQHFAFPVAFAGKRLRRPDRDAGADGCRHGWGRLRLDGGRTFLWRGVAQSGAGVSGVMIGERDEEHC